MTEHQKSYLTRDQAVKKLELYARELMAQLPADEWRQFAHDASFEVMRLANSPTSRSGSYKISTPTYRSSTVPAPPPDETVKPPPLK